MTLAAVGPACFALALALLWYRACNGNQTQFWVALVLIATWVASMVAYAHLDYAGRIRTYGLLAFLAGAALLYTGRNQPRWVIWVGAGFMVNVAVTLVLYAQVSFGSADWWAVYAWTLTLVGYVQIAITAWLGSASDDRSPRTHIGGPALSNRLSPWLGHFVEWSRSPLGKAEKSR